MACESMELREVVKSGDAESDANRSNSGFADDLEFLKSRWPKATEDTLAAALALLHEFR